MLAEQLFSAAEPIQAKWRRRGFRLKYCSFWMFQLRRRTLLWFNCMFCLLLLSKAWEGEVDIAIHAFLLLIKFCHGALPAEAQAFLRVRLELILPLAFRGFHWLFSSPSEPGMEHCAGCKYSLQEESGEVYCRICPPKQGQCLNINGRVKNKTQVLKIVSVFNLVNDNWQMS